MRPVLRILIPVGATASATSDTEWVFKAFVMETKGEMIVDGDDVAKVAAAGLALWWLVGGEAGVEMRGARRCGDVESTVTLAAGTG